PRWGERDASPALRADELASRDILLPPGPGERIRPRRTSRVLAAPRTRLQVPNRRPRSLGPLPVRVILKHLARGGDNLRRVDRTGLIAQTVEFHTTGPQVGWVGQLVGGQSFDLGPLVAEDALAQTVAFGLGVAQLTPVAGSLPIAALLLVVLAFDRRHVLLLGRLGGVGRLGGARGFGIGVSHHRAFLCREWLRECVR